METQKIIKRKFADNAKLIVSAQDFEIYVKGPYRNNYQVLAYYGKAKNPTKNVLCDIGKVEDYIQNLALQFDQTASARRTLKEANKVSRQEHTKVFLSKLVPGAILVRSWGYDQTNVNFYQVKAVSGKKVTFQEISSSYRSAGYSYGYVMPILDSFIGEEKNTIVRGPGIAVNDWDHACRFFEGKEEFTSDGR